MGEAGLIIFFVSMPLIAQGTNFWELRMCHSNVYFYRYQGKSLIFNKREIKVIIFFVPRPLFAQGTIAAFFFLFFASCSSIFFLQYLFLCFIFDLQMNPDSFPYVRAGITFITIRVYLCFFVFGNFRPESLFSIVCLSL